MKYITLIAESNYSAAAISIYKKLGPVYFLENLTSKEQAKVFPQINILVVRLGLTVSRELMAKMPNLKIIATSTTGLNHINLNEAQSRSIKIISLRGKTGFLKNIPSTAEMTFGLVVALLRNLPWAFDDAKNGNWNSLFWGGRQLAHKIIGLLGFGRLGRIVARYAKAFNMKIIACDPNISEKFMKSRGVVKVNMDELFKKSDIVSLHVLLTDETHNLVKEKHLRSMKPMAYLINTARAELIEKGLLEKALKKKWIAGAAIDVLWDEKGDGSHLKNNPLVEYAKKNKNLIILPHIGGATYEAMEITQDYIAELVFNNIKN